MDAEREVNAAAFRLLRSSEYLAVTDHLRMQMTEALIGTNPLDEVALRGAALRLEAINAITESVSQMAEQHAKDNAE